MVHGWICGTVEWDMNVKLDNTTEFVTLLNKCDCWKRWECKPRKDHWLCCTFEYMELLNKIWCKKDKTVEFVSLLNMLGL